MGVYTKLADDINEVDVIIAGGMLPPPTKHLMLEASLTMQERRHGRVHCCRPSG